MLTKEKGRHNGDPIPNANVCQDKPESKSPPTKNQGFVAVHAANARESFRTELLERHGRRVIRIGRWKPGRDGALHPAGVGIECSVDHIDGIAAMLTATKQRLAQEGK